jgi:hypothetical protein
MTIHKVPLTVGYRKDKIVGHITIDPEIEAIMLKGGMFVLAPSIMRPMNRNDEIIEMTLLPLPASEGG